MLNFRNLKQMQKKNGFKEAVLYVGQEVWARDTDLKLIDR